MVNNSFAYLPASNATVNHSPLASSPSFFPTELCKFINPICRRIFAAPARGAYPYLSGVLGDLVPKSAAGWRFPFAWRARGGGGAGSRVGESGGGGRKED